LEEEKSMSEKLIEITKEGLHVPSTV
jgi:hypothetical protein